MFFSLEPSLRDEGCLEVDGLPIPRRFGVQIGQHCVAVFGEETVEVGVLGLGVLGDVAQLSPRLAVVIRNRRACGFPRPSRRLWIETTTVASNGPGETMRLDG